MAYTSTEGTLTEAAVSICGKIEIIQMNNYYQCQHQGACLLCLPLAFLSLRKSIRLWGLVQFPPPPGCPCRHSRLQLAPFSVSASPSCLSTQFDPSLRSHFAHESCLPGTYIICIDNNDPTSSGSCCYASFQPRWAIHIPVTVHLTSLSNL